MSKVSVDSHLIPLVNKLAGHRILCIGDIMFDRFIYGQVERISPEAPIPVLHIQREAVSLGGAGNVVRNIVALRGHVDVVAVVGQDQPGYDLANQLTSMPNVTSYLLTDSSRPTTLKIRYVANGQQLLRADYEVSKAISNEMEEQVMLRVRSAIEDCKIVILSDYAKGILTPRVVAEIIKLANEKNRFILIDPKGRDFTRYDGATMLTPNRRELAEATGMQINTIADAEKAARQLIAEHHVKGILAKLGGDGVCLVLKDQPAQHFRAQAREVYDVSGAGDTVVATLALGLAGGLSQADSAALANIAGAIVVAKIGTATVDADELQRELMHDQSRKSEEKIIGITHVAEMAERWRKQGFKVGFTNGCFDLLHPGHISLIRQARAACDRLIVGLNSDESTKRLKGENRPVQNETSRATVLASLADVDQVVVFPEDTPVNLIKAIRPNVIVKGADYTVDAVVGGDLVESWGGQIVLAALVEGHGTTETINRLNGGKTPKTGTA